MEFFWKTTATVLITVILSLVLHQQESAFSLLLSLFTCCIVMLAALSFWQPIIDFLKKLQFLGDLNQGILLSLMKILGVGLTGEIAAAVCTDAGESAMSKGMVFLANTVIFFLSVPIFSSLTDLLQKMLEGI